MSRRGHIQETTCYDFTKRSMVVWIVSPIVIGFLFSILSFSYRTWTHVSDVHPEYSSYDSVYIHARGFPLPQWAINDPELSGVGTAKSVVLWRGILLNWALYIVGVGIIEIPFFNGIRKLEEWNAGRNAKDPYR